MKTTLHQVYGLLFLLTLSFSACRLNDFEDVKGFNYEAEFAVPLLNTSVSIQDILDRSENDLSYIEIAEDNKIWLNYETEAEVISGQEVLDDFPSFFPLPIIDQDVAYPISDMNGIGIGQADIQSGTLRFEWRSNYPGNLDLRITFPGIIRNNQPLVVTSQITYDGSSPVDGSIAPIDLSGYSISTNNNNLEISYRALDQNGVHHDLLPLSGFAEDWVLNQVQGEWQNINVPLESNELEVDLYNSQVEGDLYLSNPQLIISVDNSFGVPVVMSMQYFQVIMEDGSTVDLEGGLIDEGFYIDAPDHAGGNKVSTFVMNRENSNIEDIFNASPSKLVYQPNLIVAPGSQPSTGFITNTSQVDVQVRFELPVEGMARGFTFDSSTEINIGEEEGQELKAAQLKLITENNLPLEASLQLYLVDANEQIIDSVFSGFQNILMPNAPPVTTFIDIDEDKIENLRRSNSILVRSQMSTSDGGNTPVSITVDQDMKIRLGLRATLQQ